MSRSKWLKGRTTVPPLEYSIVRSRIRMSGITCLRTTAGSVLSAPHARDAGEDTDDDADRDELRILAAPSFDGNGRPSPTSFDTPIARMPAVTATRTACSMRPPTMRRFGAPSP